MGFLYKIYIIGLDFYSYGICDSWRTNKKTSDTISSIPFFVCPLRAAIRQLQASPSEGLTNDRDSSLTPHSGWMMPERQATWYIVTSFRARVHGFL
jgi:hypothetical protein